jgi:cell division protein FtsI (penicillin-binding protein 3)
MTVLVGFGLAAAILVWRAVVLQFSDREFLQEHGDARYLRVVQTEAHRGMITDRNHEPLAISTPVSSVWAKPGELLQHRKRWPELAKVLDLSVEHLETMLVPRRKREFVYLRRQVSPDIAAAVEAANVPGVNLVDEYRRYYPAGAVTGNLLGFTNVDDRGQEGIELAFDSTLRGTPGLNRVIRDRLGRIVELVARERPVQPGRDLPLSIDRRLQYVAYRELKKAVTERKAVAGHMVILDARTGEILALANQPSFNPNNRGDYNGDHFRNRAVTDLFEPGSTLKPFTIAAGIESGAYTPTTLIETGPGRFKVGRHIVRDIHNYGTLDVSGVIEKSSNVGSTKIALSLEAEQFWDMLNGVGFGQITGVELPGEPQGRLAEPGNWRQIEQATLAFGYGLSVTAVQLARAYGALANGGMLQGVSILKQDRPAPGVRVMSETTAHAVREMLRLVVERGTGKAARVTGYQVGGKTGTVHKNTEGGYAEKEYLSLFAGFIPVSAPRLIGVVIIDGPQGAEYYGGLVAAPVFGAVMHEAVRILNIAPDADVNAEDPTVRLAGWTRPEAPGPERVQ